MKKRQKKQSVRCVCPHCESVVFLTVESKAKGQRRKLTKAQRCKYFGTGIERMPPKIREEALKDIVAVIGCDPDKADGIRSTLQRSGIWEFDHESKCYTGIKHERDEK